MNKTILTLLLAAAVSCPMLAQQQIPPAPLAGALNSPVPKATLAGIVLRATTGEPITRATVTLTRVAPQTPPNAGQRGGQQGQPQVQQQPVVFTTNTDDQGKFQFKEVEEGPYRLVAARNGFTRQEYGQRSFNRPGTVLNIRAGQPVPDISFRLSPAATISGRVLDTNGEPLPGITVQALRSTYDATGKRSLQPAGSARTNDLGEYRIYWINPGRYYVSANPARSAFETLTASASQAASQAQNPAQAQQAAQAASMFGTAVTPNEVVDPGFGLTYYPNSADASGAVGLDLQPGSEMRAVDFAMVRSRRVRLTGRVIDSSTGRPPQSAAVSVSPRDPSAASSPLDAFLGMDPSQGNRYNSSTGEFVVQNVASGSYWLQVLAQGQQAPAVSPDATPTTAEALAVLSSMNTARIPVDVLGSDIENLALNVGPGSSIQGHVRIEGEQPNQNDLQRVGVVLQSTSGVGGLLALIQGGANRPTADGNVTIPKITSGDYRLVLNGLGPNLYIKEARFGQDDALNGITVSEPINGTLEIVLRTNPGQVTGVVTDATLKPVAGTQAVLVPEQARNRQDLYKTATTDQDGRFTFRGVTPGDYRVFSWEDIEPFAYFDPAVVKQYEAAGKLVHARESSSESAEVKLIPAAAP